MTPKEIAAAHPKCATCEYFGWTYPDDNPEDKSYVCDMDMLVIYNPDRDYCMIHPDITGETELVEVVT
jgi:hypothetical protein